MTDLFAHLNVIANAKKKIIDNADELYKNTISQIKFPAQNNDPARLLEEIK